MKKAEFCKEGTAANQRRPVLESHRFKTQWQRRLLTAQSLLKIPFVICMRVSINVLDVLVDCTLAAHVRDVT